ncbi:Uncharacterised protein [Chlamydia abortus]|nr:Uncharacterised protein [Chlamydia abortus]
MRVKIRTIAIAGSILLLMAIGSVVSLPGWLLKMEKYDALLTWFPKSPEAPEALFWSADKAMRGAQTNKVDRIYIFPNSSSYSRSETAAQLGLAIDRWERLLAEYPDYRDAEQARRRLAEAYFAQNNWPQAERVYEQLASSENQWVGKEAQGYLEAIRSRQPRPGEEPSITGRVIVGGKGVEDVFVILRKKTENNTWYSNPFGYYPVAITDSDGTYRFYDVESGHYEVGVGIGADAVSGFYRTGQEEPVAEISEHSTAGYDIVFLPKVETISPVNRELIDGDAIRFEWEPYPAASYYQLGITSIDRDKQGKVAGSSTVLLNEKWTETNAEYDLDTLRNYRRGISVSYGQDEMWLSTQGVLGAIFPGGEFTWYVDAFDAEGRKISSSSGYYLLNDNQVPYFTIDDREQLEGDRYVMEHRYEEAVQAYEKQLDHPYALRALARLWFTGFRYGEEGDKAKALTYLERLENPTVNDYELMLHAYEAAGNEEASRRIQQLLDAKQP